MTEVVTESSADQHEGRIAIRESTHHPGSTANLPVESLNYIVGADPRPVFIGELALGQGFLHAVLDLFRRLLQLHLTQLGNHQFGLFAGGLLLSWAWIALSIFATIFTLERGTIENTLR